MLRMKVVRLCLLTLAVPTISAAQLAPQTARQALIEMFFSPAPGTLQKHLPDAMLAAMKKANLGAASATPDTFGILANQLRSQGQFQTFEAGPLLLSIENPRDNTKFEVVLERDDLQADEDDIEVSFRAYKGGQSQLSGMSPRLIFGMKPENGIWRLNEITVTFKVSLTNPEFLKALSQWKSPTSNMTSPANGSNQTIGHNFNDASTIVAMRTIAHAEATYAATYGHGYTCSLSDLGGIGMDQPTDHHARLIDAGLSVGKKHGYHFALAGCDGTTSSKFVLTAVPAENSAGQVFCTDESAVVRSSSDGASCLSTGTAVK